MKRQLLYLAGLSLLLAFAQCQKSNIKEVPYKTVEAITQDSIPVIIEEEVGNGTMLEALPRIAQRLQQMEEIESVEIIDNDIVITFVDGMEHIVMFRLTSTARETKALSNAKVNLRSENDNETAEKKVIVWEPFRSEFNVYQASFDSIDQYYLQQLQRIELDVYVNGDCSIPSIGQLFDHDYVVIHTHGAVRGKWMATHERVTEATSLQYKDLVQKGYVTQGTIHEYNDSYQCLNNITVFLVSDTYIKSFNKRFNNSVVYGGYCHSMDANAPICDAFLDLGANAFLGFQGSVNTNYNSNIAVLFTRLFCLGQRSASAAYAASHAQIPDNPVLEYSMSFPFGIEVVSNKFRIEGDGNAYFQEAPPLTTGALPGLFTINGNGDQVQFAQGNLQYQASTNTWRFADNQFDHIGNDNVYVSATNSNWIDLFCWGTSGWNSGAQEYQPYSISTESESYLTGGSPFISLTGSYANADWAYHNSISNGGQQAGLWRCLTHEEYIYLIENRPNANQKYAYACVNGINGLVILPDSWSLPDGLSFTPQASSWNSNTYSAIQWRDMESAGAIFLPTTGTRQGKHIFYVDGLGDYWSSTASDISAGHSLSFFNGNVYPGDTRYRYLGTSVRPVVSYHAGNGKRNPAP